MPESTHGVHRHVGGQIAPAVGEAPAVAESPAYQNPAPVLVDNNAGFQPVDDNSSSFPGSPDDGGGAFGGIIAIGVLGVIGVGIAKAVWGGSVGGRTLGRRQSFDQGMAAGTMFNDQRHRPHDSSLGSGHGGGIGGGGDSGGGFSGGGGGGGGSTSW